MAVLSRIFELTTHGALPDEPLLFRAMQVREALGRLPEFTLSAVSTQTGIPAVKLLGKKVTVKMEQQRGEPREFTGHVTRFGEGGQVGRLTQYHMTVRPWLWFLTRSSNCRIFQKESAPDIIKDVFASKDYQSLVAFADREDKPTSDPLGALSEKAKCPKREYCVQYRETDFNFVSRLMEDEGIYYFWVYKNGEALLKLVDSPAGHRALEQHPTIEFLPPNARTLATREHIRSWSFTQNIQPGFVTLDEYDFKNPKANLLVTTGNLEGHAQDAQEIFDYPGEYRNPDKPDTVGLDTLLEDGDHYVTARINELHTGFDQAQAECNVRDATVGGLFTLTNAPRPDQDRQYLIVSAFYQLLNNAFEAVGSDTSTAYDCHMTVMPTAQQFRPARVTPEPRINGPQTAVVVTLRTEDTEKDEEILCDEFGRIKVRFHWDRDHKGKNDANASCFIRVAQSWAGARWGAQFLPRVGQEVLVHFLEGDPDQPIIMGSVYNADQMPPYELPTHKTQSGIKTRSTKHGGPNNFNELRFEDKKGHEEVVVHAERNLSTSVEADESRSVGHDRSTTIGHDDNLTVKNKQVVTVETDNADLFVNTGNRVVIVKTQYYLLAKSVYQEAGEESVQVKAATFIDHRVGDNYIGINSAGDIGINAQSRFGAIVGSNQVRINDSGEIEIKADSEVHITVGGSFIKVTASEIQIKGPLVKIN